MMLAARAFGSVTQPGARARMYSVLYGRKGGNGCEPVSGLDGKAGYI